MEKPPACRSQGGCGADSADAVPGTGAARRQEWKSFLTEAVRSRGGWAPGGHGLPEPKQVLHFLRTPETLGLRMAQARSQGSAARVGCTLCCGSEFLGASASPEGVGHWRAGVEA